MSSTGLPTLKNDRIIKNSKLILGIRRHFILMLSLESWCTCSTRERNPHPLVPRSHLVSVPCKGASYNCYGDNTSLFLFFARCFERFGVTIHRFSFVFPRTIFIFPNLLQFCLVLLLPCLLQVSHEFYTLFQALNSFLKNTRILLFATSVTFITYPQRVILFQFVLSYTSKYKGSLKNEILNANISSIADLAAVLKHEN